MSNQKKNLTVSRRLIEETFPIKEISIESAKEKSIRHGHLSTLHIWWARRPLASSRATSYAALIPIENLNVEEIKNRQKFIIELSKWNNSLNHNVLQKARNDILLANGGIPPKILDPFGGGGSIPLEALRLGCNVFSNDYNPVSVLVQKCTLEYPQKYGMQYKENKNELSTKPDSLLFSRKENRLAKDLKKWGNWILKEVLKEISHFYPKDKDGSIPVGYIWTRTTPCQNLSCGIDIPLLRHYWLSKKNNKNIILFPRKEKELKDIKFEIINNNFNKLPEGFDPNKGTISKAIIKCPICGSIIDDKTTRKLFREKKTGQNMLVVILSKEDKNGKLYRLANEKDMQIFYQCEDHLNKKRQFLIDKWGIDPIPDEFIHTPNNKPYETGGLLYNFTPVLLYGMTKWCDLFNIRQKLSLITFVEKIRKAHEEMLKEFYDEEYAKVIITYMALILDRLVDKNSQLVVYNVIGEKIEHVFGRQALSMVWDYVELNPFTEVGWNNMLNWVIKVLDHCTEIFPNRHENLFVPQISGFSATSIPYPDNFFDAVFTDPPYYDNIPYSDLSDFFYVWLKRTIGTLYPELFSTYLTPKSNETIAELPLVRGMNKDKVSSLYKDIKTGKHFENMILQTFKEIYRILKPDGISIIVYAHKSTIGWETLLNSLLDSGLVVTAAWPINTEMKTRLRATDSATLASSIYMIVRKVKKERIGFYREVKDELKSHLNSKLDKLWNADVAGADFFISAIGSSIEVFGKYEKVIDDEGNTIRADRFLDLVRIVVTDFTVHKILHNGFAEDISKKTRFYILWRWAYGELNVPFNEALKLSQSVGINLSEYWIEKDGFLKKEKDFIRVLGPEDRKIPEKFKINTQNFKEMIDILHISLLLWKKGKKDELLKLLQETGLGNNDIFYRVAQAISETLPNTSKEKKLIEGFLAGKGKISEKLTEFTNQRRLFD